MESPTSIARPDIQKSADSILIVDDEPEILTILKKSLEAAGYSVYGFTNSVAALEHFKQNPKGYSVVISDARMPRMSGFELVRAIRELNSEIKIIMMTAFEMNLSEFSKVLPSTKIDGLVRKPFQIAHLREVLEKTTYEPVSLG